MADDRLDVLETELLLLRRVVGYLAAHAPPAARVGVVRLLTNPAGVHPLRDGGVAGTDLQVAHAARNLLRLISESAKV